MEAHDRIGPGNEDTGPRRRPATGEPSDPVVLRITGLSRTYTRGALPSPTTARRPPRGRAGRPRRTPPARDPLAVHALRSVDAVFPRGGFTAVMGPSGSGKSTLLHCAAGLERPDSGTVSVGGRDLTRLTERELTRLRARAFGFVFQSFHLLPALDAEDNITLGQRLSGQRPDPAWQHELVRSLGLEGRLRHRPAQLSGGQQQRVAVARALLHRPSVVFADEPTGNLDSRSGGRVLAALRGAASDHGRTVVMATHDPVAAARADRVLFLRDGRIEGELAHPRPDTVLRWIRHLEDQ
ncbi:ABC transporter ATP-binding protein [Nocardiopsis aegyptia]|uniref:ABC transporter ATP-binding protein n=1 Tax=Nocardiopsis aegyptia TaxID=220378 RepID=UPI0036730B32